MSRHSSLWVADPRIPPFPALMSKHPGHPLVNPALITSSCCNLIRLGWWVGFSWAASGGIMGPVGSGRMMRDLISSCSYPGTVDQGTPLKALNFSRFHPSASVSCLLKSRALMTPSWFPTISSPVSSRIPKKTHSIHRTLDFARPTLSSLSAMMHSPNSQMGLSKSFPFHLLGLVCHQFPLGIY